MVAIKIDPKVGTSGGVDAEIVTWTGLTSDADDVPAYPRMDLGDRSVQVTGSFNGATVQFVGSNDGLTFFPLTTPTGIMIQFQANGLAQQTEAVLYVKPIIAPGGSGADITAVLAARRTMRGG